MSRSINKNSIIDLSKSIIKEAGKESLVFDCLPKLMDIMQCSLISMFVSNNNIIGNIHMIPGFLEKSEIYGKACKNISGMWDEAKESPYIYHEINSVHCYGFSLRGKYLLLSCRPTPFSSSFLKELLPVIDLFAAGCESRKLLKNIHQEQMLYPGVTEREVFFQIAGHIESVFWIRDKDKLLYVSPGYERFWGRELHGSRNNYENIFNAVHFRDRVKVINNLDAGFFLNRDTEIQFRIVHERNRYRWVRLKSFPVLSSAGNIVRRVELVEDITENKRLVNEVTRYKNKMSEMVEHRTRALYNINHLLEQEILERELAEMKLLASRAVLWSFLDAYTNLAILVDYDCHILVVNRQGAKMLGKSQDRIVGKSASIFMDWDIFEDLLYRVQDAICSKKPLRFEKKIENDFFDVQISPIIHKSNNVYRVVVFFNNITELKYAEEATRESEQRLRSIVDSMPILVHAHDEQGNYIFWNKESERVLGYTSSEVVNNPKALEMLYPDEKIRNKMSHGWTNDERFEHCETEISNRSGDKKIIEWFRLSRQFPIPGWKYWEVGLDITERKLFEQEMEKARDAAERANEVKSRFLANISHEVRTPLSGILGLSELILESELQPEQKRKITNIVNLSEHLLQIINEILDFTRIESGKYRQEESDFNLDHILETVRDALFPQAEDKDIELSVNRDQNVPVLLHGNEYCLKRVLFNLVANAIKYTEEGKIEVQVSFLGEDKGKISLMFAVKDTGRGIPPEMHEKIFEPFTQVEEGFSRQYGGTGLGLAICRNLIDLASGKLWVESFPGQGSIFYFSLNFDHSGPASEVKQVEPIREVRPLNILLVEDFEVNQEIFSQMLQNLGHQVQVRSNGLEALKALDEDYYDLVLMALQMPVMDGFEATKRIRSHKDKKISNIPIIALTAHTVSSNIKLSKNVGMNNYILKPLKPKELQKAIENATKSF